MSLRSVMTRDNVYHQDIKTNLFNADIETEKEKYIYSISEVYYFEI